MRPFWSFLELYSQARNFPRSKVHFPDLEVCCDWSTSFSAQVSRRSWGFVTLSWGKRDESLRTSAWEANFFSDFEKKKRLFCSLNSKKEFSFFFTIWRWFKRLAIDSRHDWPNKVWKRCHIRWRSGVFHSVLQNNQGINFKGEFTVITDQRKFMRDLPVWRNTRPKSKGGKHFITTKDNRYKKKLKFWRNIPLHWKWRERKTWQSNKKGTFNDNDTRWGTSGYSSMVKEYVFIETFYCSNLSPL